MNFFKKMYNVDRVEYVEWFTELEFPGFVRDNVSSCILHFVDGHETKFPRDLAREFFDYLTGYRPISSPKEEQIWQWLNNMRGHIPTEQWKGLEQILKGKE